MSDAAEKEVNVAEIAAFIARDPWAAHSVIFRHRHQLNGDPVAPAPFHPELVADFWSPQRYSIRLAFRGSAKSTLGEEDIVLAACLQRFNNILIIGSSETRAAERLASVAYELKNNDWLRMAFGELAGPVWTQTKLVLSTGQHCIQAMGRDQDIRGIKFLDYRPDFVFVDDFEDKETVQTPEGRLKTLRWFLAELLPACAPHRKVRVRATPMDAESVPMRLINESRWPAKTYPIEYLDDEGKRTPSWPGAYSLEWIDRERHTYERLGELGVWEREYMCRAVADSDRVFRKEMIRVTERQRTWQATYAMIDPARTVGRTSATTGWAVWSWLQNRLVVWAADAQLLLPDEIVALGFDIVERFDPVWLGVEEDGLEQFLMQPFRQEMIKRGVTLPLKGVRAPNSKTTFIRGLQPFFMAREVEFAQALPALTEQLLNFPTGRIDAPNALAYSMKMRPGLAIYDNFTPDHIATDPPYARDRPLYLAVNATGGMTTAALVQHYDGHLVVLGDWVREGAPAETVPDIYSEAMLAADPAIYKRVESRPRAWDDMLKGPVPDSLVLRRLPPVFVVPPHHAERYQNVGLVQAIKSIPAEYRVGAEEGRGAPHLRDLLGRLAHGNPVVEVAATSHWILRALAGGYARALVRGRLQDFAEEGAYRLLMEGLESFVGLAASGRFEAQADDENWNVAYDRLGNAYNSAMPQRR